MPNGGISLLPEEMRGKEEEELKSKEEEKEEKHELYVPGKEKGAQGAEGLELGTLPTPTPPKSAPPPIEKKEKKAVPIVPYKRRPEGAPEPPKPTAAPPKRALRVSLIPEEEEEKKLNIGARKITLGVMVGIMAALIAAGAFLIWSGTNAKQAEIDKINQDIAGVRAQLDALKQQEAELYTFEKKLEMVEDITLNHVYTTKIFEFLENNTLADVWYDAYLSSSEGKVNLSANTSDLLTAAKQITHFEKQEELMKVEVNNFQTTLNDFNQVTGVGFEVQLIFNDGFLLPENE